MNSRCIWRVTAAAGAAVCAGVAMAASLPFIETFDALATGSKLNGQNGWRSVSTDPAAVQTAAAHSGGKAAGIGNAVVWQDLSSTATNVWVDWYVQPARRTTAGDPTPGTNSAVAFYVNGDGHLRVYSNQTWVTLTGFEVPSNTWTRLTANLRYSDKRWDLYACDGVSNRLARPLATNLAFKAGASHTDGGPVKLRLSGGSSAKGYVDSITVADQAVSGMPLHIDRDGDGVSDRWELEVFGNLTDCTAGSNDDGDDYTDRQEYLAGTDPESTNSYLRIIDCDLLTPAGNDIRIRIAGGGNTVTSVYAGDLIGRTFAVRSANTATNAKTVAVTLRDRLTGIHTWTNLNAVTQTSTRFYNVVSTLGGESCTNAEEWAMYVQPRAAGKRYLVCVPVDYGGTNNTFNGALGQHLARGLYAAANTGDTVRFWTAAGSWARYTLTESDGTLTWIDDNDAPADTPVTPGMALWVYRTGNAPYSRTNAVFTGKSFAEAQAVDFTFNAGAWTAFGWPLARERAHSSGSSAPNQLGFYAVGTGGKVSTTDAAKLGDEIWVWKNNTWCGWYSLIGNTGSEGDGRWWDNFTRRYANITLEPGMAYYYYHRSTWGGTNFTWRPQVP